MCFHDTVIIMRVESQCACMIYTVIIMRVESQCASMICYSYNTGTRDVWNILH